MGRREAVGEISAISSDEIQIVIETDLSQTHRPAERNAFRFAVLNQEFTNSTQSIAFYEGLTYPGNATLSCVSSISWFPSSSNFTPMATTAQIEANRRNSQHSTGPRTPQGKARSSHNAFTNGNRSCTILAGLPHEDLDKIQERTVQSLEDLQPRDATELDLIHQMARLSLAIERGDRMEIALMASRVDQAAKQRLMDETAEQRKKVRELGRKLIYIAAAEDVKVERTPPAMTIPRSSSRTWKPVPKAAAGCWSGGRYTAPCSTAGCDGTSRSCSASSGCKARRSSRRHSTWTSTPSSWPGTCWRPITPSRPGSFSTTTGR